MKFCEHGGFLVEAKLEVPIELTHYQPVGRRPPVGCNQLYCNQCGHFVRSVPNWRLNPGVGDEPRRIANLIMAFAVADWQKLKDRPDFAGVFEEARGIRAYLCECGNLNMVEWVALHDPLYADEQQIPWYCNGHPE